MQFLQKMCRREAVAAISLLVAAPILFAGAALKLNVATTAGGVLAMLSVCLFIPTYLFSGNRSHSSVQTEVPMDRKGRRARQRAERRAGRK